MKHQLFLFCFLFFSVFAQAQITGKVTDTEKRPLQNVNVYVEGTFTGTTTNASGEFKLNIELAKSQVLIFKFLGFETERRTLEKNETYLEVQLSEKVTSLDDVVITSSEDPAYAIIRNAIAQRKENLAKIKEFKADFYSKGLWEIQNAPKKILGQEVGDLGGGLDSTRSGVVYLSETVSKIAYKAPNKFKERIIASKVSGNDRGFSFNSAEDFNFSFYENTIDLGNNLVSPIADFALSYYDYELVGTFYDNDKFLVNKIKVIPKRPNDIVFSGHMYILEDTWEIYGIELKTTGKSLQIEVVDEINLNQTFKYSEENAFWALISQDISFSWGIFGVSGGGDFVASYQNYDFNPGLTSKDFNNAIIVFEKEANTKDSLFWKKNRPVPLTSLELKDYAFKDSIQTLKNSPAYKDSIDAVRNTFSLTDPVFGYSWQNSTTHREAGFTGLTDINNNTVQGFNIKSDVYFRQKDTAGTYRRFWELRSFFDYGFSEEKLRVYGKWTKKFNNFSRPFLSLSGGTKLEEINSTNPINERLSTLASVFFERNYLKLYETTFGEVSYSQEVFNGLRMSAAFKFERRRALINSTNSPIIPNENGGFTANNPLAPQDFGSLLFPSHNIGKLRIAGELNFDQEYVLTPNGKYNTYSNKFPVLSFLYEKGMASDLKDYHFDLLKVRLTQTKTLSRFGELAYSLNGGLFFNADEISFLDYKHFAGNQTRIGTSENYLNQFNLLPYYALSTNSHYADVHVEHNFKSYVLNKVPLLNQLNFNLVIGAKSLFTDARNPYSEFSVGLDNLGFGEFRFFRLDYVKPYQSGWQSGALIFGIKLLDQF
ncbi:DUF5686 and carboxypeptidase regulatory-like domain-containing protein [Psychroflexus sediminis]|uniref:CarboxypepD_reg-like domain-containing protein n=1 Tax=Psychroflexus sediminis TaxID=470826 RepID=A0A1G7VNK9_9FLAO|nr:DUF5686 and carboxypeptidase regulatory-like domain-containing protein [Psychroflexus sediminis]SDG61402.1 CarboxypepD_reg-like domain-containing protein [Psychroflexus sediminis]